MVLSFKVSDMIRLCDIIPVACVLPVCGLSLDVVLSDEQALIEAGIAVSSAASVTLASTVAALGPHSGPEDIYQRLQMFISSCNSETAAAAPAHGADTDSLTALVCVQPDVNMKQHEPS